MKTVVWALVAAAFCLPAQADNVLIVDGGSTALNPSLNADAATTWSTVCNAQNQHTVTRAGALPANLSAYQQIWDIRGITTTPLTTSEMSAYAGALSSGTSVFLMGENSVNYLVRNNSLFQFVDQVGGGQLTNDASNPGSYSAQTVYPPLNGNGLSTLGFQASGTATAAGLTGTMATVDTATGNSGSAFVWPVGTLANAPAGKLSMVLDVNFMMSYADPDNRLFLANLCGFMAAPSIQAVPAASPWSLLGTLAALGSLGMLALRRQRRPR